jgi:integrase/recombinase XerC
MPTTGTPQVVDVDAVLAAYGGWLKRQPLSVRSRDAYLAQVREFVGWLAGSEHSAQALVDPHVRDWAVRDYKRFAKTTKRWGPASVNQALRVAGPTPALAPGAGADSASARRPAPRPMRARADRRVRRSLTDERASV